MADQVKITELPESPTLPPGATAIVVDPTDPTDAPTGTTKRIAAALLVGPKGDQGEPGADGADLALAGSGSATTAARSDHTHAGVYQPADNTLTALAALDGTAGLLEQTGPDTFTRREMGTGAASSVLTRGDGDARYVDLATNQTISGIKTYKDQFLITHFSGTASHPYLDFRRFRGTSAAPSAVQAGDRTGAIYSYGYHAGGNQGTVAIVSRAATVSGAYLTGSLTILVNSGTSAVADHAAVTVTHTTTTLATDLVAKNTTVQGNLTVTGTISGDGSPLTGVAKPADLAALARQVSYPWGGASPTTGVKTEARRRVARAATAIQIEAGCVGTRTGDCTLRVLRSTDGGATWPTAVGTITLSDSEDTDYSTISVALAAGDYLCVEVVSVGGAATWWVALTCLSAGGA